VVTGCLAQRNSKELEQEMPEVDHFLGTADFTQITNALTRPKTELIQIKKNWVSHELKYLANYDLPRVNSMPKYTAYLKISEGCDNACAFCIIPKLRGKQRSRTVDDLVREAKGLASQGVVEISLIAQDLTAYGHDLPGRPTLAQLLKALNKVEDIQWVRCLYAYPRSLSPELMEALAMGGNILPYLDIPVQHGSDKVLRRMRRGKDQAKLTELLLKLREKVPGLVLRSTVMVGFPGEDEEDFQKLMDFAGAIQFERLGVFKYSDEEGTAAFDFDSRVPYKFKQTRYAKLMRLQKRIHRAKLKALVGTVQEAIVEGPSEEHPLLMKGRIWSQAPDIDGVTYLSSETPLTPGQIIKVRIDSAHDYDLVGTFMTEPLVNQKM
jgi:ribosomal protein S12 methylthiotransferase